MGGCDGERLCYIEYKHRSHGVLSTYGEPKQQSTICLDLSGVRQWPGLWSARRDQRSQPLKVCCYPKTRGKRTNVRPGLTRSIKRDSILSSSTRRSPLTGLELEMGRVVHLHRVSDAIDQLRNRADSLQTTTGLFLRALAMGSITGERYYGR